MEIVLLQEVLSSWTFWRLTKKFCTTGRSPRFPSLQSDSYNVLHNVVLLPSFLNYDQSGVRRAQVKKPSWQDDDDKKRRVVVGGGGRKKYFFWTKKFADFFDSLFREKTFLDVTSKCSRSISLGNQCDQMSILNNEICPMAYKICQSRLKILPRTCNILPKCRNLAKSGHTVGTICPWSKIIFKCEYFLASFLFFSILLNR